MVVAAEQGEAEAEGQVLRGPVPEVQPQELPAGPPPARPTPQELQMPDRPGPVRQLSQEFRAALQTRAASTTR